MTVWNISVLFGAVSLSWVHVYWFPSRLGKPVKGHSHQNKIIGLSERHSCPWPHGLSALDTIPHLPWEKWRLKERNLLFLNYPPTLFWTIKIEGNKKIRIWKNEIKLIKFFLKSAWNVLKVLSTLKTNSVEFHCKDCTPFGIFHIFTYVFQYYAFQ